MARRVCPQRAASLWITIPILSERLHDTLDQGFCRVFRALGLAAAAVRALVSLEIDNGLLDNQSLPLQEGEDVVHNRIQISSVFKQAEQFLLIEGMGDDTQDIQQAGIEQATSAVMSLFLLCMSIWQYALKVSVQR